MGAQLCDSVSAEMIPVAVSTMFPDRVIGVSLYLKSRRGEMRLYRGDEYPLTSDDLALLAERGISWLYVSPAEHGRYQRYMRETLTDVLEDDGLSMQQRFGTLNQVVRDILGEVFHRGEVSEVVERTRELGAYTVDLISSENAVARELCGVLHHDYTTFTHSANVSYYCVMLARELGITDSDELHAIAAGALLHDLGKLEIPPGILNKPGKLTHREFAIVKQHPTTGFRRLCNREDVGFGQLMMVYQHHERPDGSGYPVGAVGDKVHAWARICAVADVFEALTSERPYRRGLAIPDALEVMDRADHPLDSEMYRCWRQLIRKA